MGWFERHPEREPCHANYRRVPMGIPTRCPKGNWVELSKHVWRQNAAAERRTGRAFLSVCAISWRRLYQADGHLHRRRPEHHPATKFTWECAESRANKASFIFKIAPENYAYLVIFNFEVIAKALLEF